MNIKQLNSVLIAAGLLVAVNCYTIDPDEDRNVPQIIESRGFIAESHYVTTEDGYILTVHRIVNPDFRGQELKPVLMQHGLLASSVDFIINSPDGYLNDIETTPSNNLGFVLAKRGFDVWLGNSRGNIYSSNHTSIPVNKKRFWQFTFDEMIKYDLPSTIDYVRNHTQSETIAYVGHSQGTVIMFGLLSTQPKYNDIIKPYIALAPVTTCSHIKSPIKYLAYDTLMVDYFKWRGGPFLPPQKWIKDVSDKFCPFKYGGICADVMFLLGGFDGKQMNVTRSPVYIAHTPAGTSAFNIIHWAQGVLSRKFQMFDFGMRGNLKRYSQLHPPEYMLENITNKYIALFRAKNDWLADPQDVEFLKARLQEPLIQDYEVPFERWNHIDFIWGMQAGQFVNEPVLALLKKYA